MKKIVASVGLAFAVAAGASHAQGFDQDNLYIGGGLGINSLSGFDNATGFQFFGGYKFPDVDLDPVNLAVEVGYMTTGDFEYSNCSAQSDWWWDDYVSCDIGSIDGLWATAVFGYPLSPEAQLLGRIGLDFGDDDGLMFGFGAGYALNPQIELRGEYVIRDNVNSIQANVVYHF